MNDLAVAGIGHNRPPVQIDDNDSADGRAAELVDTATRWLAKYPIINSDEAAVAATDFINQLNAQYDAFDEKRKAEREPHNKALKAIQEKWLPRLERIKICLQAIKPLQRDWIRRGEEQRKAADAAANREAAEAQRRAYQLAAQAEAGGPNVIAATILAHEATEEAKRAAQLAAAVPKRTQIRGDLGGRTHSLRTVWYANIVEIDKTFAHYKGRAEVKELLTRLATADARNPRIWKNPAVRCIPGVYCYSEQE